MSPNNDETRQFGWEPQPEGERRCRERPKQYFPEPESQQAPPTRYDAGYDQTYNPYPPQGPPPDPWDEPVYDEGPVQRDPDRSGGAALALGIVAALATAAALVFMFLWRGAAKEAERVPETVTVTQTQQLTITQTTTESRRSLPFGRGGNETGAPATPVLPTTLPTDIPPEVGGAVSSIVDGILGGVDNLRQQG